MKRQVVWIALALAVAALPANAGEGCDSGDENSEKRGWFWGYDWCRDNPEEPKEEEKESEKNVPSPQVPSPLSESGHTFETLWAMHPDVFSELMSSYHKKAVQNPSVENVKDYKVLEDVARRKAKAVADTTSYVVQKYPYLSVAKDYPATKYGRVAYAAQKDEEIEHRIKVSADEFGLLYFYSPGCRYCAEQSKILDRFLVKYGWDMSRVNTDLDPETAATFSVETVPHLELVYRRGGDSMPVASGVVSLGEIEERLYRAIRLVKGETDPQNMTTYDFQKGGAFDVRVPSQEKGAIR